jgi:hypothetical protein
MPRTNEQLQGRTTHLPRGAQEQPSPEAIITHHWETLNHAPGQPVSGLENIASGFRMRYSNGGAIYLHPNMAHPAWVYGSIGDRYSVMGGPNSWLGFPTADEADFPDGGRVSTFDHGAIYWWQDVGAIELDQVVVQYTGLICFGETDWDQGSASDEPYVILGTVAPQGTTSNRSQIYERVNAIQGRSDSIEVYRGKPYGLALTALLMEHDDDNPDRYKAAMGGAVTAAFGALGTAAGVIATPVVAVAVAPLLAAIAPVVTESLNDLLDLRDDNLGQQTLTLSAKQMIVLAARTPDSVDYGVTSKLQTPLFTGEGSSYKVCFRFAPAT